MVDVARLSVVVDADTVAAERGLANVHQQVAGLGSVFQQGAALGAGFGVALAGVNAAIGAVGSAFSAFQGSAVGLNNQLQQSTIAFTTMLGSAEQAGAFIQQLQTFAARTPFEFPGLVTASQRMLAMGFAARDVVPLLTAVGNAASALGSGDEGINRITLALGQMQAKTRVSAEEMLQLTEAGIPAWQILADATGKTTAEVQKMAEQGQISSNTFIEAFQRFSDAHWGDMMEKQSHTFAGAMSTIRDSVGQATATAFKPFFDVLTAVADKVATFVSSDTFQGWARGAAAAAQSVVDALAPIGTVLQTAFEQVGRGNLAGAFDTVVAAVKDALAGAVQTVDAFGQAMFGAGWNLMKTLAGGIVQGATDAIQGAINFVADLIASFFVGQSPPPAGPLSQIDAAGRRLMETYGEGMKQGLSPVEAAAKAVGDQFANADLTAALDGMTTRFDQAKGSLAAMKAVGDDVDGAIKTIDLHIRDLDHSAGAVRYTVETIKDAFEDQIRPLERQLALLRGAHDFGRDEQQIAFEERDIALRREEIAARGNKSAEEAVRKKRDAFNVEKELYDLGNRQKDLAEKRSEIPLLQQIDALKRAQQDATTPLEDQLRVLERQKAELSFQKSQWSDLKATIADAVQAATPKGGGGGGAGGLKIPAGAGAALNLKKPIDDAVENVKASIVTTGEGIGQRLGDGISNFFRTNGPQLIGGALGAVAGGALFGPIGALIGADLGASITRALTARGVDWDAVGASFKQGMERATTFIGSIFSGDTLATATNKGFGDLIPADLNPKLDAVDGAVRRVKDALRDLGATAGDLASAFQGGGISGAIDALASKLLSLGAPETAGAVVNAFQQISTAASSIAEILGGVVSAAFTTISSLFQSSGAEGVNWGKVLDAVFAGVVTSILLPVTAFNALVTAAKAMQAGMEAATAAVGAAWTAASTAVEGVLTAMDGSLSRFSASAGAAIDGWVANAKKQFDDFRTKVGEIVDGVKDFAGKVVAALEGLVKDAGGKAEAVANAIVDGLIGPITRRVQEVANTASSLVNGAIDAAKKAAGVKSPSTVFMELGFNIVEGLRVGISGNLNLLDSSMNALKGLLRRGADEAEDSFNALIGFIHRGNQAPFFKEEATGYMADFLKSGNNVEQARALGETIRSYFQKFLDQMDHFADDAAAKVAKIRQTLQEGLADAVATATKQAQDAVQQASQQIGDAIANLAEQRDVRGRRSSFEAGLSAQERAYRTARDEAEAVYQLNQDLAAATSAAERRRIQARFDAAEKERAHQRDLAEQDRQFELGIAAQRQAFEDQLADEALAKQIGRILIERDARLAAIKDELAAREAGLVGTAQKELAGVSDEFAKQVNAAIAAVFDNMSKTPGFPTAPAFLDRLRSDFAAILVPYLGFAQGVMGAIGGSDANTAEVGLLPGVPLSGIPLPGLPAFNTSTVPVAPAPSTVTYNVNLVVPQGAYYGSITDLARAIQPELSRLVTAAT